MVKAEDLYSKGQEFESLRWRLEWCFHISFVVKNNSSYVNEKRPWMFHIHFQLKLCPTPQSLLIFYLITEKYGKRKQQNFWDEIIFIWKFSFDRTKYDEWPGRNFSRRRLPVRQKLELNFQLKTRKKLSQEWVICFL